MIKYIIIVLFTLSLFASDIRIGYSVESMSEINKKDLKTSIVLWMKEILSQTNYEALYIDYEDSLSMAKAFNKRELDLVIEFGINYIKNYEIDKLVDGFRGASRANKEEKIIIVLKSSSSLEEFAKLTRPVVAYQPQEEIFKIFAEVMLLPDGKKYTHLKTRKRSGALLKLFFNSADAAIVSQKTFNFAKELNPQIGTQLKIVAVSDIEAGAYGFFHKDFDAKKRENIIDMAVNLDKNERGKQLLALFKIDIMTKSKISELDNIKKLYEQHKQLFKGKN